jgi:hypothetical protein
VPRGSVIGGSDQLRGGGFDGDLVTEGYEFKDESAFAGFGIVDAAGEVVRAELAVGGGLGEHVPYDHNEGMGSGDGGLRVTLLAGPTVETVELRANIGTGAPRGSGALGAFARPAGTVPVGGLVVARG